MKTEGCAYKFGSVYVMESDKKGHPLCRLIPIKSKKIKIFLALWMAFIFGVFTGISFPQNSSAKWQLNTFLGGSQLNTSYSYMVNISNTIQNKSELVAPSFTTTNTTSDENRNRNSTDQSKIWVVTNPKGAETLPPKIVVNESDLFPRRLWGLPIDDLPKKPKYLVIFTVGIYQKNNVDAAIKKFSDNFTIVLFHYDGRTNEWDEFEWSKQAIHVSVRKQTKWWYAKRFLHPDIVAPYDYIFIWDEDLGLEHFDAEEYIKLVKKHNLEISQPALDPISRFTWPLTMRINNSEVHKQTIEKDAWCPEGPHKPPCAAFVEIMAPVFSRKAWRCVWHMIPNDLVHGWGLDFNLQKCVEPAYEKIGVVDAQWIVHQSIPSLGSQGQVLENGTASWQGVRERCQKEWQMFNERMADAEKDYNKTLREDGHRID